MMAYPIMNLNPTHLGGGVAAVRSLVTAALPSPGTAGQLPGPRSPERSPSPLRAGPVNRPRDAGRTGKPARRGAAPSARATVHRLKESASLRLRLRRHPAASVALGPAAGAPAGAQSHRRRIPNPARCQCHGVSSRAAAGSAYSKSRNLSSGAPPAGETGLLLAVASAVHEDILAFFQTLRFVSRASFPQLTSYMKYYAVRKGIAPGVYTTWEECRKNVEGFAGAQHKSFKTEAEAEAFLTDLQREKVAEKPAVPSRRVATPILPFLVSSSRHPSEKESMASSTKRFASTQPTSKNGAKKRKTLPYDGPPSVSSTGILTVFTDGACPGNGKKKSCGGVGVWFGEGDERNLSETYHSAYNSVVGVPVPSDKVATNQRVELLALARAFDKLDESGVPENRKVEIYTDSTYAMKCVTEWIVRWKRTGWKTASGGNVLNREIIEAIDARLKRRHSNVEIKWVRGHAGFYGNEEADRLAVSGAAKEVSRQNF